MKTNVYVDGFNLYYGCIRNTPYRWLDLSKLCAAEFPNNQINRIRYFTALVSARPSDPQQPARQQAYLRALATIPNLSIHYGQFKVTTPRMTLVNPPPGGPTTVEVIKTEEKGSDVNIATYLLLDAFRKDCEAAIILSNDSDLTEPIRVARRELGIRVVVLYPLRSPSPGEKSRKSIDLAKAASKSVVVKESSLAVSQFPSALSDPSGLISKPSRW